MLPVMNDHNYFDGESKGREISLTDISHLRLFKIVEKLQSSLIVTGGDIQSFAPLDFTLLENRKWYRVLGHDFLSAWSLGDLSFNNTIDALRYLEKLLGYQIDCMPSTMATRLIWSTNRTGERLDSCNAIDWTSEEIKFWTRNAARDLSWCREAGDNEGKYLHCFDRNTQYLFA